MTLEEASAAIGPEFDAQRDGDDLVVTASISWSWSMLRRLAEMLGTDQIDMAGRDEFSTIPGMTTIQGRYKDVGGGCESCGHGDQVIVRGFFG